MGSDTEQLSLLGDNQGREPGALAPMGSPRVRHDSATKNNNGLSISYMHSFCRKHRLKNKRTAVAGHFNGPPCEVPGTQQQLQGVCQSSSVMKPVHNKHTGTSWLLVLFPAPISFHNTVSTLHGLKDHGVMISAHL